MMVRREEIEKGISDILQRDWIYVENDGAELVINSARYNDRMDISVEKMESGMFYVTYKEDNCWYYYTTVGVI